MDLIIHRLGRPGSGSIYTELATQCKFFFFCILWYNIKPFILRVRGTGILISPAKRKINELALPWPLALFSGPAILANQKWWILNVRLILGALKWNCRCLWGWSYDFSFNLFLQMTASLKFLCLCWNLESTRAIVKQWKDIGKDQG